MSGDDRFGDLGPKESIGDRLAERDRTHPEPVRKPEVPRPGNKYAWLVGILMLMGLGVLLFAQTLPNQGDGLFGPAKGTQLVDIAAPAALGNLEGDANVCQKAPCPEDTKPACEVISEEVVNTCELREKPLVLTVIFDRGADCYPQVDRTERVRADFGKHVNFATLFFTRDKSREDVRNLVQARGWSQPVGIDSDGTVANVLGVGGCPTTIFAREGGRVLTTKLGNLSEAQLRRLARRL